MTGEYRILRVADDWNGRIGYTVQLKKRWWVFSWWSDLCGDTGVSLSKTAIVFGSIETAEQWAKEFLKGSIAKEGCVK